MITSGVFPKLVDSDPVYTFKTWADLLVAKLDGGTGWTAPALGPGWTAVTSYPLQFRKSGKCVYVRGIVKWTSGAYTNRIATLPAAFRPTGQSEFLQPSIASGSRVVVQPFVTAAGDISIPAGNAYATGNMAGGDNVVISGSWLSDAT